ncbi:MAG: sigma-70 family RNA polymerase sigma factor [Chloroflexota bacterium]
MPAQNHKPEFAELVDAHGREMHAFLWRLLRDQNESEDCLQSAFLKAFRAYNRMPAGANYRAWLYKIASNEARTQLRRRAGVPIGLDDDLRAPAATVEDQAERRLRLREVAKAIERLPYKQRAALVLSKYQDLSYADIGEILGTSPEAARANAYQALRKLRGLFREAGAGQVTDQHRARFEEGVR